VPSAVRPIGAQLSTRAVVAFGVNLVCDHAGCDSKSITKTSFFIGLRLERLEYSIEPDR